ncbi:Transcriptional regulator PadR-like family protein [Candidatus Anstonella stagnisolia]|nr:Transcriptional regulator PadR-like family protein [Candidatus Anstonella stagnisolia]
MDKNSLKGHYGIAKGASCKIGVRFLELYFIWRISKEPAHGYSLHEEMQKWELAPPLKYSTVYMILSRLEKEKYIEVKKREISGRVRKVYAVTAKGKEVLQRAKAMKIKGRLREFLKMLLG